MNNHAVAAIILVLVAIFAAAVLRGVPPVPAFVALMAVAAFVLYRIAAADAQINEQAGYRIDQRNAARDQYWAQGGKGDPPGLDQQLPRLPEVSRSVKGEILAILTALAFLAWALSL